MSSGEAHGGGGGSGVGDAGGGACGGGLGREGGSGCVGCSSGAPGPGGVGGPGVGAGGGPAVAAGAVTPAAAGGGGTHGGRAADAVGPCGVQAGSEARDAPASAGWLYCGLHAAGEPIAFLGELAQEGGAPCMWMWRRALSCLQGGDLPDLAATSGLLVDLCWEKLHTGHWSLVPLVWRDAYTLASLLLAAAHARPRAPEAAHAPSAAASADAAALEACAATTAATGAAAATTAAAAAAAAATAAATAADALALLPAGGATDPTNPRAAGGCPGAAALTSGSDDGEGLGCSRLPPTGAPGKLGGHKHHVLHAAGAASFSCCAPGDGRDGSCAATGADAGAGGGGGSGGGRRTGSSNAGGEEGRAALRRLLRQLDMAAIMGGPRFRPWLHDAITAAELQLRQLLPPWEAAAARPEAPQEAAAATEPPLQQQQRLREPQQLQPPVAAGAHGSGRAAPPATAPTPLGCAGLPDAPPPKRHCATHQDAAAPPSATTPQPPPTPLPLPPRSLAVPGRGVELLASPPPLEVFVQRYMLAPGGGRPVIICGAIAAWPALQRWRDLSYLQDMAGLRTVPVEVGEHYLQEGWGTQLMTLSDFLERHMAADGLTPAQRQSPPPHQQQQQQPARGYLAQHALFDQIPTLAADISTPDYCVLGEEGLLATNAWLGPAGTVTPLHYDPNHNLLAQVVGTKYVRLYSPACSQALQPFTSGMHTNSSSIDLEAAEGAAHAAQLAQQQQAVTAGAAAACGAASAGCSAVAAAAGPAVVGPAPGSAGGLLAVIGAGLEGFVAGTGGSVRAAGASGACESEGVASGAPGRVGAAAGAPGRVGAAAGVDATTATFLAQPFLEAHLSPGQMLYIPPRWWHWVKATSASFSVSFWWA